MQIKVIMKCHFFQQHLFLEDFLEDTWRKRNSNILLMKSYSSYEKQPMKLKHIYIYYTHKHTHTHTHTHRCNLVLSLLESGHNIKNTIAYKDIYSGAFIAALLLWGKQNKTKQKLEAKLISINRGIAEKI